MPVIFGDLWFLAFVPLTVGIVWITPDLFKRWTLLAACGFFHAHYAGPAGMAPILILAALVFYSTRAERYQRGVVIAICALALLVYKYTGYLNSVFGTSFKVYAAPLAISFFVFEFIHLLTDINRKKIVKKIPYLDFSLFTIFFPSLACGPIKRFPQFQAELARLGRPSTLILGQALMRILLGYYKKFGLADSLANELPLPGRLYLWHSSIVALSLMQGARIYLDFSGYTDIAIGLAGLLNIRLPENFSFPYLASSISEFWRRWHISLSSWIRDYVYFVLGGSRGSVTRTLLNLSVAMVLCGFWHGPALHFALWGALHGVALLTARLWSRVKRLQLPPVVGWAMTFSFVQLSWLLFFYDAQELLGLFRSSPWL